MTVADRLIAILARELGLQSDIIAAHMRLREDLGMDSIVALNVMFSAERELGIFVTEEEIVNLRTVADLQGLAVRLSSRNSDS